MQSIQLHSEDETLLVVTQGTGKSDTYRITPNAGGEIFAVMLPHGRTATVSRRPMPWGTLWSCNLACGLTGTLRQFGDRREATGETRAIRVVQAWEQLRARTQQSVSSYSEIEQRAARESCQIQRMQPINAAAKFVAKYHGQRCCKCN